MRPRIPRPTRARTSPASPGTTPHRSASASTARASGGSERRSRAGATPSTSSAGAPGAGGGAPPGPPPRQEGARARQEHHGQNGRHVDGPEAIDDPLSGGLLALGLGHQVDDL